jgi:DNA-binding MarR family transcriptional regulator
MPAPPTPCACTALRKAARRVTLLYDRALAPSGLGVNQYALLVELERQGGGPVTLGGLARVMVMDRSALGHTLRPLERDRLIAMGTAVADRRSRAITLTEAGSARLAAARPLWQAAQTSFQRGFGAARADALRTLLGATVAADYGDA